MVVACVDSVQPKVPECIQSKSQTSLRSFLNVSVLDHFISFGELSVHVELNISPVISDVNCAVLI